MDVAESLNSDDYVEDSEILYRAVRPNELHRNNRGHIEVKPEAFRDKNNRPSVDRAHLVGFDPERTRNFFGLDQGVVNLRAVEVRSLSPLDDFDSKGNHVQGPQVDVEPVPLSEPVNLAHAEIYGKPHIEKDNLFRRLRISLARLAEQHQDGMLLPP